MAEESPRRSTTGAELARVAVIGAGISGLICARTLQDHGLEVTVFEKSRGPGGRAATRRADPGLRFDHGAQYFTARDPEFIREVESWIEQGIAAEWKGRIVEIDGDVVRPKIDQPRRYVGTPGMASVGRQLAADLPVRADTRIVKLSRSGGGWELWDAEGRRHGAFDGVVVSIPAPQVSDLLGDHAIAAEAAAVSMTPCWAVMAAFARRLDLAWDGAFVHDSPLAWVARDSSKPGRDPSAECWVLHASPDWSAAHCDLARDEVKAALLGDFAAIIPDAGPLPTIVHSDAHRWLFSSTLTPLDGPARFDPEIGLALCGDWLAGGKVEGAFHSGVAAAGFILRSCGREREPNCVAGDGGAS